jgi:hypothetical protein
VAANATAQRLLDMRQERVPSKCAPTLVQPELPDDRLLVQRVRARVNLLCKGYASPPAKAYWLGPDGQPIAHHDIGSDVYPPLPYALSPAPVQLSSSSSSSSSPSNAVGSPVPHHVHSHHLLSSFASGHHQSESAIGAHAWLRLTHLNAVHEGTYTCVLNSTLGRVERKVRLLVERVRMRLQVEQLGSSHVTVSWQLISELHARNSTEPRSEANLHRLDSRPLQYEVLYRPDDQPMSSVVKREPGKVDSWPDSGSSVDDTNDAITLPHSWTGFEVVAISPHLHSFTVAGLRSLKRYMLCVGVREQPISSWEPSLNDQPAEPSETAANGPDVDLSADQPSLSSPNDYEPYTEVLHGVHHRSHRHLSYVSQLPIDRVSFDRPRRASSERTASASVGSVPAVYLSVACVRVSTSQAGLSAQSALGREHVRQLLPVAVDRLPDESQPRDDRASFTNELTRLSSDWWAKVTGNYQLSELAARLDRLLSRLVKLTAMASAGTLLLLTVIGIYWSIRTRRRRAAFETPRKTLLMHMQHPPSNTEPPTPNLNDRASTPQIPMESIYSEMRSDRHSAAS